MKRIVCLFLLLITMNLFAADADKIVNTSYYCSETCGDPKSYEILTVDLFNGLYNTKDHSWNRTKVCFLNMRIAYIEDYGVQLRNSEGQWVSVYVFNDEIKKKLILSKGKYVNIYGHVYNHVRHGYGITPDLIEFVN